MNELEAALLYGLTQAKPGSAAHLLALEVQRLRPIADAAASVQFVGGDEIRRIMPAAMGELDRALDAYGTDPSGGAA